MNHERPDKSSRRDFLQKLGGASFLLSTGTIPSLGPLDAYHQRLLETPHRISPGDTLQIGCIGMGIMGFNDSGTAVKVPGVKLVAACDLYTGRLQRAREVYGQDLATTRDYREILDRKDIDAVIIATNDSWHARIATEALGKGKAVYCEKPMVHKVSEGLPLIEAYKRSGKAMQVGSQRVSSIAYAAARDLYKKGEIGQLTCIEASFRQAERPGSLGIYPAYRRFAVDRGLGSLHRRHCPSAL